MRALQQYASCRARPGLPSLRAGVEDPVAGTGLSVRGTAGPSAVRKFSSPVEHHVSRVRHRDRAVLAGCRDPGAVRAEHRRPHLAVAAAQHHRVSQRRAVPPHPYRAVAAAGGEAPAVRTERDAEDLPALVVRSSEQLRVGGGPER